MDPISSKNITLTPLIVSTIVHYHSDIRYFSACIIKKLLNTKSLKVYPHHSTNALVSNSRIALYSQIHQTSASLWIRTTKDPNSTSSSPFTKHQTFTANSQRDFHQQPKALFNSHCTLQ